MLIPTAIFLKPGIRIKYTPAIMAVQQTIVKYLPDVICDIVNKYHIRSENDVIDALLSAPVCSLDDWRQFQVNADKTSDHDLTREDTSECIKTKQYIPVNDRWIFECSKFGTFTRFLGIESGTPCEPWSDYCRIVVAFIDSELVIEINRENYYCRCDCQSWYDRLTNRMPHGRFFNLNPACLRPFSRRARALLKQQLVCLTHHLSHDDPFHKLLDRTCDLADRMISDWYF